MGGSTRVSNDSEGSSGPFSELLRLQSDFQARLTEETLRYLRRLQGTLGPTAPGTVVKPADGPQLTAVGQAGGRAELEIEIENLQRTHCLVTALLSPFVDGAGATWFPATDPPSISRLLAPSEIGALKVSIPLPAELAAGHYRGALLLQGFRSGALPVTVTVTP
jgi:hypothetical protein